MPPAETFNEALALKSLLIPGQTGLEQLRSHTSKERSLICEALLAHGLLNNMFPIHI